MPVANHPSAAIRKHEFRGRGHRPAAMRAILKLPAHERGERVCRAADVRVARRLRFVPQPNFLPAREDYRKGYVFRAFPMLQ
jgi:hypothetical protein